MRGAKLRDKKLKGVTLLFMWFVKRCCSHAIHHKCHDHINHNMNPLGHLRSSLLRTFSLPGPHPTRTILQPQMLNIFLRPLTTHSLNPWTARSLMPAVVSTAMYISCMFKAVTHIPDRKQILMGNLHNETISPLIYHQHQVSKVST